jgi:glycosyltransferase involved in cell wall biosynthesis
MRAKFSVAMCTYNGAPFVVAQLESIAAQTRLPDELVVCDDGSTDDTVDCVRAFARNASFPVRLIENEETLGSTKNFERAIGSCEGDLIALADQDDVWLPAKLERLEHVLKDENVALAFTDGEVVDESLRPRGERVWQSIRFTEREQRLFRKGRAFSVLLDHNVVTGAALAINSNFRELVLPIPNNLVHDGIPVLHDWWSALLISAVANVSFISEPLFKYRQHSSQQMGVINKDNKPAESWSVRARRQNTFNAEIAYVRTILQRLSSIKVCPVRSEVQPDLEARLKHLETRAAMPENRFQRISLVFRELMARRYHLYSNGLVSAAKDFWV